MTEKIKLVVTAGMMLAILAGIEWFGSNMRDMRPKETTDPAALAHWFEEKTQPAVDPVVEQAFNLKTAKKIQQIDEYLYTLFDQQRYSELREELLTTAAEAVSDDNKDRLGEILSLLGQISIEEQDLGSAEVFLTEALQVAQETGSELGEAQIYMQLGRLHVKTREIARSAGYAYDALQIGRWQLQHRQYAESEATTRKAIEINLQINRYNSAASGYETLADMYRQLGNRFEAEEASLQAARLYASSGRDNLVETILQNLTSNGIEQWRLDAIAWEMQQNFASYQEDIEQIGRARDYQRLYNYYNNVGDQNRAWHFRLLANNSLAKVSKRAMFHRQQGVLAILYNSNDSMQQASDYLEQARSTFDANGLASLSEQTLELTDAVY